MRIFPVFIKVTVVQILKSAFLEETKELQLSLTSKCPLHLFQIFQAVAQAHFLLVDSQSIFCLLSHSYPKLSHKQVQ